MKPEAALLSTVYLVIFTFFPLLSLDQLLHQSPSHSPNINYKVFGLKRYETQTFIENDGWLKSVDLEERV